MWGRKKRGSAPVRSFIGSETRIHGDIEFTGGLHVDGYVKGNVEGINDKHAVLSISESGLVEGWVSVPHILLNGVIRGDVRATERMKLGPGARMIGDVQYRLIEMSIGAEVSGKLIHENERQTTKPIPGKRNVNIVSAVKATGD